MRRPRILFPPYYPCATYHTYSRIVDKDFKLTPKYKDLFLSLLMEYVGFCGLELLTFEIMDNHFHIFLDVPKAKETLTNEQLLAALSHLTTKSAIRCRKRLLKHIKNGNTEAVERTRQQCMKLMWDLSTFMKLLLQRFTQIYNKENDRTGTLWEGRFGHQLVQGDGSSARVGAYVDLNCVRADMEIDPENYRWGGYGRASQGDKVALNGIKRLMSRILRVEPEALSDEEALLKYREFLTMKAEQSKAEAQEIQAIQEEVKEDLAAGKKVPLVKLMRCRRIKQFTKPLIVGSPAFIEEVLSYHHQRFGKGRKMAYRIESIADADIYVWPKCRNSAIQ